MCWKWHLGTPKHILQDCSSTCINVLLTSSPCVQVTCCIHCCCKVAIQRHRHLHYALRPGQLCWCGLHLGTAPCSSKRQQQTHISAKGLGQVPDTCPMIYDFDLDVLQPAERVSAPIRSSVPGSRQWGNAGPHFYHLCRIAASAADVLHIQMVVRRQRKRGQASLARQTYEFIHTCVYSSNIPATLPRPSCPLLPAPQAYTSPPSVRA